MIVTALRMRMTPRSITEETCSPRKSTPITIAVRGSIAPRTEVSVEAYALDGSHEARLEMRVGRRASSRRFTIAPRLGMGCTPPESRLSVRKKIPLKKIA